jgi:hypothetical protein
MEPIARSEKVTSRRRFGHQGMIEPSSRLLAFAKPQ